MALPLSGFMEGLVYGVGPRDPATWVGVAALLVAVTVLASVLPARRGPADGVAGRVAQEV